MNPLEEIRKRLQDALREEDELQERFKVLRTLTYIDKILEGKENA